MQQKHLSKLRYFSYADALVLALVATLIYGAIGMGREWQADFHPLTEISLSYWELPRYVLLSAFRGVCAYFISLAFTLVVGYSAAKSKYAEWFLIPMLDIMQSIPVLGFLPGLVLTLIALFPRSNIGLELAAILMIFTGQVWNMTFSFYASLKSIPIDFQETTKVMGLNWKQKLLRVELPFSALGLAWNSLLSMAGGWFFLSVCEAFSLGSREFRLPGVGAYMAVAIAEGNVGAMIAGVVAMALLIVAMDIAIWRPVLAWVHRYRIEDIPGVEAPEPWVRMWMRESWILERIRVFYRRLRPLWNQVRKGFRKSSETMQIRPLIQQVSDTHWQGRVLQMLGAVLFVLLIFASLYGVYLLVAELLKQPVFTWVLLFRNSLWTFLRVVLAVFLSTLWTVPVGVWLAVSPQRLRIAQPIIQILASFPAPMLYPLVLSVLLYLKVPFDYGSMFLMMMGVQWYILFNVVAGGMRISNELSLSLRLMKVSRWQQWSKLYLPSVFPHLVNGWMIAAGGAWNASIVAEIVMHDGSLLETQGLGSTLSRAAANQDVGLLCSSLFMMVVIVVLLNRTLWAKLSHLAQNRFRMEILS